MFRLSFLMYKVFYLHSVEAFTSKSLALFTGYPLALYTMVGCTILTSVFLFLLGSTVASYATTMHRSYFRISLGAISFLDYRRFGRQHARLNTKSMQCIHSSCDEDNDIWVYPPRRPLESLSQRNQ
jgi:hypothetical protein